MNWCGGGWLGSMTLGKWSLTRMPDTPAHWSTTKRSFPVKMPGLAKHILQTGFRAPRRNHLVHSCHHQRPRLQRIEPETMVVNETHTNEVSNDLVISGLGLRLSLKQRISSLLRPQAAGWEDIPAVIWLLPTTRLRNSPTTCTNCVAGRMAITLKIGYVQNSHSFTTTRSCKP